MDINNKYLLTSENIDIISEQMAEYYSNKDFDAKTIFKLRLSLEEVLLKYQIAYSDKTEVEIKTRKLFEDYKFIVLIKGSELNPFASVDSDDDLVFSGIFNNYDNDAPAYSYANKTNKITFSSQRRKKFGLLPQLIIALALGVALGLLSRNIINKDTLEIICTGYITPVTDIFIHLLSIMAVIFVFLNIALGISGLGDLANAKKVTFKMIGLFFLIPLIACVVVGVPLLIIRGVSLVAKTSVNFKSIFDLIVSMFPTDLITPFKDFLVMPTMIIGTMFGLSMLALQEKSRNLRTIFEEINLCAIKTNNLLTEFISIYVFLTIFTTFAIQNIAVYRYSFYLIIIILIALILLLIIYTAVASSRCKMNPFSFFRKLVGTFIINITTGSFSASFTVFANEEIDNLGVDASYGMLGLQLASMLFRPALSVVYISSAIFMANYYNVKLSVPWLILAIIICVLFSVATPNMIGGPAIMIPLLFSQLGIPFEAVTWMVTLSAVIQLPITAVDSYCSQAEIFLRAMTDEKVDYKKLYAGVKKKEKV